MNEQYIDNIHRFLSNSMDASERETFEKEALQNQELQKDIEMERLLIEGVGYAGEKALREKIHDVHQKLKREGFFNNHTVQKDHDLTVSHSSKTPIMKRIIAIAATLVALVAAVWFFTRPAATVNPDQVFAQFYKPDEEVKRAQKVIVSLETKGLAGVQTDGDTLRLALQYYEDGRYEEAKNLLKLYLTTNDDDDMAQYYLGVVFMCQGFYAKAIEMLQPLATSDTSALKNDALWNLGLCYLKTENNLPDARDAFAKLANDNNYAGHREAKAVLEQLLADR